MKTEMDLLKTDRTKISLVVVFCFSLFLIEIVFQFGNPFATKTTEYSHD